MTIFIDASAIVAIMNGEAEADTFSDALEMHNDRCFCAVGAWEAARAMARLRKIGIRAAADAVTSFANEAGLRMVEIGAAEAHEAIEAHRRYGKGTTHPARLNMGDCFAYACARTNDARLLYKGNDFAQTDLA